VREMKRKLQWVCCRLYPFDCWIIIKEGPGNLFGGRIPHWVNHIYLCLYCIVYLLYFISAFVLFYCSKRPMDPGFFLTDLKGHINMIKIDRERYLKYTVTDL
jgi:hypothetical protein